MATKKKSKRIMVQCTTAVNKNAVKRETIDGVEHIIVSSFTLPDDIIMNGGLYPASEIASSFHTLENTLAPLEHPRDSDGNFLSANDPVAIHNFHVGAYNRNVKPLDGRISIEKVIHVPHAMKSDKGKRLLDRINELETSDNPRPMHTSVSVFLIAEELDEPVTNEAGHTATWVARKMVFDHDAILLDNVAAALPSQGVGMAVNVGGEECELHRFILNDEVLDQPIDTPTSDRSLTEIERAITEALTRSAIAYDWIVEVFSEQVIFNFDDSIFSVPYLLDGDRATIVGIPIAVERNVTFSPRTNKEGNTNMDKLLEALKAADVSTEGLDDDDSILTAYNKLIVSQSSDPGDDDGKSNDEAFIANAVANAIKPLVEEVAQLRAERNAQSEDDNAKLAELVGNSDKYPGIDVETAKTLPLDALKKMAANCGVAYGIPTDIQFNDESNNILAFEMPK